MINDPLLAPFLLPNFPKIKSKNMIPAILKSLENCQITVEEIVKNKLYTWEDVCQKFAEVNDILNQIFTQIDHLNSVKSNLKIRHSYEKILPIISKYRTWIGQNKKLYKSYYSLKKGEKYKFLDIAQKKALNNTIRDFRLSGIKLSEKNRKRYSEIVIRLSELSNQYSNNVLDATEGWNKLIKNKIDLFGTPENIIKKAKIQAKNTGRNGYLLTLDTSDYFPIMTYCKNRNLRKEMYYAYNTRASDQGPNAGKWDNSLIMEEILSLRNEVAMLLGFKNYANKSLVKKMTKNTKQILNFLYNLAKHVLPHAKKELSQLRDFSRLKFGIENLRPWDINYYSEKQRKHLYHFNNEQLRSYFPENKVISGLFDILKRIYGFSIKEKYTKNLWNSKVRFFKVYNLKNNFIGSFYLDLYSRKNKHKGAWMNDCIGKMKKSNGLIQKPVAYLVCNFSQPIEGKPVLLTQNEINTLFHEFGHVLHHISTCIEVSEVSGIRGVPWDIIEFPSQFMENWCLEPEVLSTISSHYKTNEPLPNSLLKNILESKNYQSAMFILRQIEFSLFDLILHMEFDSKKEKKILDILEKIRKQVSIFSTPKWVRFPHTFSHIFSGGYASGYYGYLWSKMFAIDAYSKFKENGIFNQEVGCSFLRNILSKGGSEEPMKLFRRFLGRKPKINEMLKYYGIFPK